MRSTTEVQELFTFLLERGAVHIKVGETVEAVFPPPATVTDETDLGWAETPHEPSLREYVDHQPLPRVR